MTVQEVIRQRRSIRKFKPCEVSPSLLLEMVESGRLYASAINRQPIRFALIAQKENRDAVFSALNWAMCLKNFKIEEAERPMAYILLMKEAGNNPFFDFDAGACATNLMLMAEELGLKSCVLKIARPEILTEYFSFTEYEPVYALALGEGAVESKAVERVDSDAYYLDDADNFCVPKRSAKDLTVFSDVK